MTLTRDEPDNHDQSLAAIDPAENSSASPLYSPLPHEDSLRILELLPGDHSAPIACKLFVSRLSSSPAYEAISYAWGDPTSTVAISCEGHELHVTKNLYEALRRIRNTDESIILWADAICIDQNNLKERGHQVKLMGDVFKGAACVLVWIGHDTHSDAENSIHVLKELQTQCKAKTVINEEDLPRFEHFDWKAWRRLLERPYFTRVWTIQEVGLARRARILYGDFDIDWRALMDVLYWLQDRGEPLLYRYRIKGPSTEYFWRSYYFGQSFLDLLGAAHRKRQASDPRDFIYAFLGHPSIPVEVLPDYTKSVQDIYLDFTITMLLGSGPDILLLVDQGKRYRKSRKPASQRQHPSWCPQWDQGSLTKRPSVQESIRFWTGFDASYAKNNVFKPTILDRNTLVVEGVSFDRVRHVSDEVRRRDIVPCQGDIPVEHCLAKIIQYIAQEGEWAGKAYEDPKKAIAETLIGEGWEANKHALTQDLLRIPYPSSKWTAGQEDSTGAADEFISVPKLSVTSTVGSTCFFVTERGYFGLGPRAISKSDICCILLGARFPCLLRPSRSGSESTYRFIGSCYVYGLMQGQAIDMVSSGQLCEEWFHIV